MNKNRLLACLSFTAQPLKVLKISGRSWLLFSLLISVFVFSCQDEDVKRSSFAVSYNTYCGSCHLTPDPKNIPKAIWKKTVLPEMAARMGYTYDGYDPYRSKSPKEKEYIGLSKKYPEEALIDSLTWWGIHDYIISLAPEGIPVETERTNRNKLLSQFLVLSNTHVKAAVPIITAIQFDETENHFNLADVTGHFYQWPARKSITPIKKKNSGIIAYQRRKDELFVTEIGTLQPSEVPTGLMYKVYSGRTDTIAKELHRPVFTEVIDLNADGIDEVLICEFGDLTGQLSLLERYGSGYVKKALYPQPGAIKTEIADMNGDGKKDVIALFSQGDEGIVVFYQGDDLHFKSERLIRLPPEYGSSWFELLDYDGDGDMDIVMVNGDNADYSIFLKPYHGIRLFLNDGTAVFEQKWFYPIYGATRVLGDDYDLDGDIDFAVTALFNDAENAEEEGFIYLENLNSEQFEFQPRTLELEVTNGWLTMAKGDYDSDGDVDLMLGSFNVPGLRKRKSMFTSKEKKNIDFLILENDEKNGR